MVGAPVNTPEELNDSPAGTPVALHVCVPDPPEACSCIGEIVTFVIAVDSAPHDQLFPRAAAIVHQCGVGTTGQALRSGKPQLAVPWAHDQPDNAFRVQQLGAGEILYPGRYRAPRVAAALGRLLSDRAVIDRADAVGQDVRSETGAETAARTILNAI